MSNVSELDPANLDRKARLEAHAVRIAAEYTPLSLCKDNREVVSRPDAREMTRREIANIEPLSEAEEVALFKSLDVDNTHTGTFASDDDRWTLTPHELRKVRERNFNPVIRDAWLKAKQKQKATT